MEDAADISGLLFFQSSVNSTATEVLAGLTGLSSIAGGFDLAYVNQDSHVDDLALFNTTLNGSSGTGNFNVTSELGMGPVMTRLHDRDECGYYTMSSGKKYRTVDVVAPCRFWTEGVLSSIVAFIGLLGNIVSIWVLSVPELRNSFNRLLMALAITDCLFIVPGIVIYMFKAFGWQADWYNYAFPVFLYPFSEMALCSSIYMTVAIAVERYIGLCRPLKRLSSGRGPCSAKAYILPVVIIAVLLNVPKFFESETAPARASFWSISETKTMVKVTDLRTNPNYITFYWMWTRLLATGVIPLGVLAVLNSKIYMSIRQSKQQLRILAIRSALPMAILGQNAPSVPVSELLSNKPTESNFLTTKCTGSGEEEVNNDSSCRNGLVSPKSQRMIILSEEGHVNNSNNSASSSRGQDDAIAKAPESPKCNNVSNGKDRKEINGIIRGGRFVNGQFRHIQRSISAFDERTRHFRSKDFLPKNFRSKACQSAILRSNSTSATATTTVVMHPNSWRTSAGPASGTQVSTGLAGGADIKLAPILFGVVIVFVLCNSLRIALNIYEFTEVDAIISCEKKGVGRLPPAWVLCTISISHLLLMVNSSINFLGTSIY